MQRFEVVARDAIRTDLDSIANNLICQKQLAEEGHKKDYFSKSDTYHVTYSFSEDTYSYSYSATNTSVYPMEITLDFN